MNTINLLPWRDTMRRERRRQFHALLLLAALTGLGCVLLVSAFNARQLAVQESRNQWLRSENLKLGRQLDEIRQLDQALAMLEARRTAVEGLQRSRGQAVQLLDALASRVPEGIALRSVRQAERITLTGWAQSNARVSGLLRELDHMPGMAGVPELVEVKAASLGQGREPRRLFEFTIALQPEPSGANPPADRKGERQAAQSSSQSRSQNSRSSSARSDNQPGIQRPNSVGAAP